MFNRIKTTNLNDYFTQLDKDVAAYEKFRREERLREKEEMESKGK